MCGMKNSVITLKSIKLFSEVKIIKNILYFVKHFEQESVSIMMKKAISVSLSLVMLTTVLHFSVATHLCGGTIAASKISFSGTLASCGMETDQQDLTPPGSKIVSHCCENVLVFYGINNIYLPEFSFVPESYQQNFQVFILSSDLNFCLVASKIQFSGNVSPPGAPASNSVDLSSICVFRI
jgi:hypothetical protein